MSGIDLALRPTRGRGPSWGARLRRRPGTQRFPGIGTENMIAPRFGFAYAVSDRLVVRGGYGINNMPFVTNGFSFPDPLVITGVCSATPANTTTPFPFRIPVLYLDDRYPDFPGTLPNKDPAAEECEGIICNRARFKPGRRTPRTTAWGSSSSFPLRRCSRPATSGNKGNRLESNGLDQLDQLPVSALALGDRLLEPLSAGTGLAPLPYPGFTGSWPRRCAGIPRYNGITEIFANFGTSHYDSLQLSLTRHLTNGLAVLGSLYLVKG